MTKYNAGDKITESEITEGDGLSGAGVSWSEDGATISLTVHEVIASVSHPSRVALVAEDTYTPWHLRSGTVVTVLTPPPVKVVQPEAPKVVDVWPYENTAWPYDDTPLRGWRWRDREGDYWEHQDGQWKVCLKGGWMNNEFTIPGNYLPLTRVGRK